MNQTKTRVNLAHISDPGKTPQAIMSEAQVAMDESNKRGAAYNVWYKNSDNQTEQSGSIACWKEGLILAMQVCEASLVTQDSIQGAFTECSALLRSNRKMLSSITASGGSAQGLNEVIAESESSIRRLADAMAKERIRCDKFLATWDQLAGMMADWYNLPRQAICQFDGSLSPQMFDDQFGEVFDPDYDSDFE
jgi:hypothetical protein